MGRITNSGRRGRCRVREVFFLYGPSGSGKSSVGRHLAASLGLDFHDLDVEIEGRTGMDVPTIFAREGETGFRKREKETLQALTSSAPAIIALGGGALLDPENRERACGVGEVLCLRASAETLLARLGQEDNRPLLQGDRAGEMRRLLQERKEHYDSFPLQLDTEGLSLEQVTRETQIALGAFHVRGMGSAYDVRVGEGILDGIGHAMRARELKGPLVLVSDEVVGAYYAERTLEALRESGYVVNEIRFPAGEANKNIEMVCQLWEAFVQARMERRSTVVALGGGVVGDLTGFAAATFLRGIPWVNLPTTVLAMVDASVGGKTGANLAQGKNLIGAFHAPRAVFADTTTLATLSRKELRNGLAEAVKHGVIGDEILFERFGAGEGRVLQCLGEIVRRAIAVKVEVIEKDPYESGLREALNLGHTLGHAIERASEYAISHGEAVAIGIVAEARISERIGLGEVGMADCLREVLSGLNLPVEIPGDLKESELVKGMGLDKKRAGGRVRFSLPVRLGEVKTGVEIEAETALELIG
jgi:shikimate kinase/3-dehydroquinate synthase